MIDSDGRWSGFRKMEAAIKQDIAVAPTENLYAAFVATKSDEELIDIVTRTAEFCREQRYVASVTDVLAYTVYGDGMPRSGDKVRQLWQALPLRLDITTKELQKRCAQAGGHETLQPLVDKLATAECATDSEAIVNVLSELNPSRGPIPNLLNWPTEAQVIAHDKMRPLAIPPPA